MSNPDPIARIKDLATQEISAREWNSALSILQTRKVAIFIVAYNAERHLRDLMSRIPVEMLPHFSEIFVIDDSSQDSTFSVAQEIRDTYSEFNIRVYRTPYNRGYGGNQKLGYLYSIEQDHDIVVLLHGDGQYAPEYLPKVLAAFEGDPDAVFASRMLQKRRALEGGMPLYKWVGNRILTNFENRMLGAKLSEFHTGFRAYRVASLKQIPFEFNSDDFHFDTEIIIQAIANHWDIREVPIPAYYGDEQCHVNGIKYAYNCVKSVLSYYLVQLGLFYQRNYDFGLFGEDNYQFKKSPYSLHQYVLTHAPLSKDVVSLELGANHGILSNHLAQRVRRHVAADIFRPDEAPDAETLALDLNQEFSSKFHWNEFDCCFALDVIEHMNEPEHFLTEVFRVLKLGGKLYVSTANIGYILMRLSLLLGQFNYGKRGILDRTHKRLFSVPSFQRLLKQYGFRVESVRGFAPPVSDLVSSGFLMRFVEAVHAWFSRVFPSLFAYNFLVVAERMDGIADILDLTIRPEEVRSQVP